MLYRGGSGRVSHRRDKSPTIAHCLHESACFVLLACYACLLSVGLSSPTLPPACTGAFTSAACAQAQRHAHQQHLHTCTRIVASTCRCSCNSQFAVSRALWRDRRSSAAMEPHPEPQLEPKQTTEQRLFDLARRKYRSSHCMHACMTHTVCESKNDAHDATMLEQCS